MSLRNMQIPRMNSVAFWLGVVLCVFCASRLTAEPPPPAAAAEAPPQVDWPRQVESWTGVPRFVTLRGDDGVVRFDGDQPLSRYVAWLAMDRVIEASGGYTARAEIDRSRRRLDERRAVEDDIGLALAYDMVRLEEGRLEVRRKARRFDMAYMAGMCFLVCLVDLLHLQRMPFEYRPGWLVQRNEVFRQTATRGSDRRGAGPIRARWSRVDGWRRAAQRNRQEPFGAAVVRLYVAERDRRRAAQFPSDVKADLDDMYGPRPSVPQEVLAGTPAMYRQSLRRIHRLRLDGDGPMLDGRGVMTSAGFTQLVHDVARRCDVRLRAEPTDGEVCSRRDFWWPRPENGIARRPSEDVCRA